MEHVTLSPARIRKNKYVARKLNELLDILHELKVGLEQVAESVTDKQIRKTFQTFCRISWLPSCVAYALVATSTSFTTANRLAARRCFRRQTSAPVSRRYRAQIPCPSPNSGALMIESASE